MKNNVFLKTLLLVSLACIVGSSNAQTISEGTSTISRTFYKNDGTPLEGVKVIVTRIVKNGRNISLGPVTYVSNASGVVSIKVPQGSTVYMEIPGFNTSGGVPVNVPASSGWTYASDATKSPAGKVRIFSVIEDSLRVQRNDVTLGTKHTTIDFSTTFNATESPTAEANISINHDSLKARPGSKLNYLHNLFVDRGLSAWDETSLANAHTKALDSNFVLIIPHDYPATTITFSSSDDSLKLICYGTLNITSNQTIPKNASIVMAGKGKFDVSSGKTLTFASGSRFYGGLHQRFTGSGTVKFQEDVVEAVYPQWWGALGDSSTQSVSAFQSAVNSGVKRIKVKVPSGAYRFNDKLTIPSNVSLIGDNARIFSSDTSDYIFHVAPSKKNIKISGFETKYLPEPKVRASNKSAFYINECDTLEISHCIIRNAPGMGMQLIAVRNAKISFNHVEYTNADGIHVTNGLNSDSLRQLRSENVIITNNTVKNNGDDKIAVVSYARPFPAEHDSCVIGHNGCPPWTGAQLINRNIVIANNIVEGSNDRLSTIVNGTANTRGITVLGGEKVVIDGNTIKGAASGSTAGSMTRGILISNAPSFWCYRPVDIVVSNNIITDAGAVIDTSDIHAGIGIDGADSVLVVSNKINWAGATAGIRVRGSIQNENFGAGYVNNVKNLLITGNTVQDSKVGLSIFTNSTNLHENITFVGNTISNTRRQFVNVDGVKNLYLLNNICLNVNTSNAANINAVRVDTVDNDLVIRGNVFRSGATNPTGYAIAVSGALSSLNFVEKDNLFELTPASGYISFPSGTHKYASQAHARVHYGDFGIAAPTTGTWAIGDVAINNDPSKGEVAYWICTAAGPPAKWIAGTAIVNGIGINDTTEYTLSSTGTATITGVSHVRLDTYAGATLDTVVTLTGRIGQLAMISSKNTIHDIVFIDDDNKFDLNQEYVRLRSPKDVLFLLAYSANQWKQVGYFADNTSQNRFSVDDTVGVVLSATGTATIEGIGNLILDTFGAATLDTVTALTGNSGQIVYISTKDGNHDIVFLDGTNFRLNSAKVRLHAQDDVLVLKATTPTIWKQIGWLSQNFDNNRFTIDDTTGVVLSASGAATVSGIGNVVLDTFGAATLDTVTTLTGSIGQVAYISSRSDNRDLVFQDGANFKLSQGTIRLQTKDDVLLLKATTTTSWKQIAPFGGNNINTQFSLGDTTGFVLSAPGAATVSGFSNVVLDTFGGAAADTAVTLTGDIGQIVYIKTRSSTRDIRFRDLGNFALQADRLLDHVDDVLALIAITTTTWKELFFANNN